LFDSSPTTTTTGNTNYYQPPSFSYDLPPEETQETTTTTSTFNNQPPQTTTTTTTTSTTTPLLTMPTPLTSYYNNNNNNSINNNNFPISTNDFPISTSNYNQHSSATFFAPNSFSSLPPLDDPLSELPSYSAPEVANFQMDVQYASTVHFSTFFRSSAPAPPILQQDIIDQYPLAEYHYQSPDDLLTLQLPHSIMKNLIINNQGGNNTNNNDNDNNDSNHYLPPSLPNNQQSHQPQQLPPLPQQQKQAQNVIEVDQGFFDSSSDDEDDNKKRNNKKSHTTEPHQRITLSTPSQPQRYYQQPQQQQFLENQPYHVQIPTRHEKYPFRESIPESFSPILYHSVLYSSYKYCWGPIPLILVPLTIGFFIFAGFLLNKTLAFVGGFLTLGLVLASMSIYHLWSLPYSAWRNHGPEHFLAFPGSSVQHALPFDPILCGLFCCRSRQNNTNDETQISNLQQSLKKMNKKDGNKRSNKYKNKLNNKYVDNSLQHEQQVAISRRTAPVNISLQQLSQKVEKMDRCKPVLMFAVTCYRDYNSFHLVNRYHTEGRQLKEISKANISPFRCHLYYIEIESFANVSCPAEEISAIANGNSLYIQDEIYNQNLPIEQRVINTSINNSIPEYLRDHYALRPLRASYIEFHATYALHPEDYAWVNEARDKLAEIHTNDTFQYVDVDVLYSLDGLSSATSDFHFYRDLEGLSVIPLDISPNGLNHFSKYNTDGANNPRGLSSFGTAGDLLRDFDYELTFSGISPINTFLPIPLQVVNQKRLREEEERLATERVLLDERRELNKIQNIGLFNQLNITPSESAQLSSLDALGSTDQGLIDSNNNNNNNNSNNNNNNNNDGSQSDSNTNNTNNSNNDNTNMSEKLSQISTAQEALDIISKRPSITPEEQVEIIHCIKQALLSKNSSYDHETIQSHPEFQKFLRATVGDIVLDQHGNDQLNNIDNNNNHENNNNHVTTDPEEYDTISRLILPDVYRTSCKLPFAVQIHGFHITQLLFNTITFILFLGLGLLPLMSLLWRNTWCCAPRKYAFYHKKMLKLKRTYILPDSSDYLTR
jgi:hypothetical protein